MTTPGREPPFVAQLRSRPGLWRLGGADEAALSVRVSVPEAWDTLGLQVAPSVSVRDVKLAALEALVADGAVPDEFVCKLNGFEILDETLPVAEAGVRDGSTILLTYRRRRPVR
jgi:hypothetical protein